MLLPAFFLRQRDALACAVLRSLLLRASAALDPSRCAEVDMGGRDRRRIFVCLVGVWSDWLTKKAGHHVVDSGPYRLVRHPIYFGLMFAAFATAIEKGTSFALCGAAILALSFYAKARREERFLREELGEDAYDAYARKTPMLLPFTVPPPDQDASRREPGRKSRTIWRW
jgi:hypothetical protein